MSREIWWNFTGFDQQFVIMAFAFIAGGFAAEWNSVFSFAALLGHPELLLGKQKPGWLGCALCPRCAGVANTNQHVEKQNNIFKTDF